MKVGICFDLRNPVEWTRDGHDLYGFILEMCQEAERLGIDSIWLSEHHLFDDGYLPQTLTYAAAVAARTKTIAIGTGILIAPLHSAVEIAEQAAVVDLISGGRLLLGLGAGYRVPEFVLYGAEIGRRYQVTDERVRQIRRLWSDGGVTPRPYQHRVPIFLGYQGPRGARRAGLLGESLLSVNPALLEPYRDGLKEGGFDQATARRSGTIQAWATSDPEREWPVFSRHLAYQLDSYRRHMVEGTNQPVPRPVDPARIVSNPLDRMFASCLFGTPEEVARGVLEYIGEGEVDTVFFWGSIGGMPEDHVARGVATICTELAPLLRS
jgi:alkanesulfonate monooxygenase SsuD/methylene tetrahydromethanopterin reductase-like flavin-dependent oxidoreductase (luciferase family)